MGVSAEAYIVKWYEKRTRKTIIIEIRFRITGIAFAIRLRAF